MLKRLTWCKKQIAMKKRFIVLIDFSKYSNNLLKYAYDWSRQINAELLLVHQTAVLAPALTNSASWDQIARAANNDALRKLEELASAALPPFVKVSYSVSDNLFHETLPSLLAEPYENILFVGLKGTGLFKKIFIGSVAVEVIESANNIVVAIPKDISAFSQEKIFVAVNKKQPLNIVELNNFLDFIDETTSSINFFYLAKPNEKIRQIEKQLMGLSKLFAERFNTSYTIYEGANSFSNIKKVINNKVDEILIVQKGSRLLTDKLFRKFLINELVHEGQTPLVVLP